MASFGVSAGADTSSLLAVNADSGEMVWQVGRGEGSGEELQQAKFLTAPTCHAGRLYVLAKVGTRYQLLCLAAATGKRIWSAPVGPVPTHTGSARSWQTAYTMEVLTERASRVTVSEGRVFLTTNSGLVSAFDAKRGTPIWAYRYDSSTSGAAGSEPISDVESLAYAVVARRHPLLPQNPVIELHGRVICLPCDSAHVLALNALTGELLWQSPRRGAHYLTAVDAGRVLLASPHVSLRSAYTGEILHDSPAEVLDRPAVTTDCILGVGPHGFVRIDLGSLVVESIPVDSKEALLGNLVIAERGLVASANLAGISVFEGAKRVPGK